MNKIKVIVLFLILIFISGMAGCPIKTDTISKYKIPFVKEKTVVSNVGLIVEFLPGSPPSEISVPEETDEDDTFDIGLKLSNYGNEPVSGNIKVYDSLSDEYGYISGEDSFNLEPADEFEEGKVYPSEKIVMFEGFMYNYDKIEKEKTGISASISMMLDTNYIFDVSSQICISKLDSKIKCNDKDTIISKGKLGRGALTHPITISEIEKEVLSISENTAKLKFNILFENVGKGIINNKNNEINNFELSFDRATRVKCSLGNNIPLVDKKRKVECTVTLDVTDFEQFADERFNIYYEYPYRLIANKKVIIRPEQ